MIIVESADEDNGKKRCSDRGTCVDYELYCICNEKSTGHNCSECMKYFYYFIF